jgi:predicted DNA-binding ribbon-helix-helix protein
VGGVARDHPALRGVSLNDLITEIDRTREASSLTAAIRVYIVAFYRNAAAASERTVLRANG